MIYLILQTMKLVILLMNSLIQTMDKLIISMKKTLKKCMISGLVVRLKNRLRKQQLFFILILILYRGKTFGKHKELRSLGWLQTYSDGVAFHFKSYLVHRNLSILLKGLNTKYCNCHFCKTFFNLSQMEALLEKIQKMNLSSKAVISGECLAIELTFLDDVIDSFYNMEKWRY